VRYKPFKGVAYPPTGWSQAPGFADPPATKLELDWCYGYRGKDCRSNVHFIGSGNTEVAFFCAATAVVYNSSQSTQRFFTGHNDDIVSLAVHPNRSICATGQLGRSPKILVWDSKDMSQLQCIEGFHTRGVLALAFSPDGSFLTSVGKDNDHTVAVWDWLRARKVASEKGHNDSIFACEYNPHSPDTMVTCGVKHIKFWSLNKETGRLQTRKGIFGSKGKLQTILCIAFGPDGTTYTGTFDGSVYVWKGNELAASFQAHNGPCLAIATTKEGTVTGGKDGKLCVWDLANARIRELDLTTMVNPDVVPSIRALSWVNSQVLVGTGGNQLYVYTWLSSLKVPPQPYPPQTDRFSAS
jgi:microtubule-associated protein-like 6